MIALSSDFKNIVGSALTSLSITISESEKTYIFSGSSVANWTLPSIISSIGQKYRFKNRGSANLIVNRLGSDQIFETSLVTFITIPPGDSYLVENDGTYWNVM